jgi:glutamate dehydrogenase
MYRVGDKVELSQAMPTLEHLGLRVVEERPTRLLGGDGACGCRTSACSGPTDLPLDLEECGERVAQCIAAVWRGEAESDSLNRLIINAGLDWRRVAILRAYRKYRQRIGSRFTESYQNDVIAANPHITAKLIRLFELRNDPAIERDEEAEAALREDILVDLEAVPSLDHDRILRNQLGLIEATGAHQRLPHGRRSIAFKLSSADVPAIPQPPPLFEIYVYAPEVEGIHLRGGKIARGGLRWSDRMDYRTEVFGLMRAQMTKNAVIVPDGAKGGFYLRRAPDDPAALKAEVERGYVTFVSGLLDLTDNLVEGEVVHPEGVRVLDDDDTYLVGRGRQGHRDVLRTPPTASPGATASGWATRSPRAARRAMTTRRWDHARGAWESLKRHFRELDLDPAVDEFTAVGHRRHVRRRLRQRDAAERQDPPRRRLRPPPRLHRPRPRRGEGLRRAQAALRAGRLVVGRLRPRRALEGGGVWARSAKRIELPEQARARWHRGRGADAQRGHPRRSSARRSTCCGTAASARWSRPRPRPTPRRSNAPATPSASTPPSCAAAWSPRAATSG